MPRLLQRVSRQAARYSPITGWCNRERKRESCGSDTYIHCVQCLSSAFGDIFECTCLLLRWKAFLPFPSPGSHNVVRSRFHPSIRCKPSDYSPCTTLRKTFAAARFLSRLRRSLALFYKAYPERSLLSERKALSPKHDGWQFDCHAVHEDKKYPITHITEARRSIYGDWS